MQVSEFERHQLFVWFEERMGPERAATMMNLIPPFGWSELATKHDLSELEARIDARFAGLDGRFARLESSLTRSFVTWLLASQATVVAATAALITLT